MNAIGAQPFHSGSPELDLVRACIRRPAGPLDAALIQRLAQGAIRWPHLVEIAHHHQVVTLVSRGLEEFAKALPPRETAEHLRNAAVENARLCFQRISHLARLNRLFREKGIELRCFKGIPLAISAFGDPTLRDAGDIDLLIGERDLREAERILLSEGYRRTEPPARLSPRRMRSYAAHQKDFSFEHLGSGVAVDLHWRLFRNPWLPANREIGNAGLEWLELGAERIPILPSDELFLYLCTHGALDGWLRLKWLADIGALLRRMSPGEMERVRTAAEGREALPEVGAAVILCEEMLGFSPAPALRFDARNRTTSHIVRLARRLMTSNDARPVRDRVPTTTWFRNEFSLHSSLKYRAELVQRSLFRPRVWETIDLPDTLFPLYAVLSPVEWLRFRIRRLGAHLRTLAARRTKRSIVPRLLRLTPSDLALILEAGSLLTFFRIALKFLPVHRITEWLESADRPLPTAPDGGTGPVLRRVEWALGAVVRHAPLSFVCFPQALAAYFMLRRRHIASRLFYGVARDDRQLTAHTWLKVGDRTIVGGEAESRFTVLAIFP